MGTDKNAPARLVRVSADARRIAEPHVRKAADDGATMSGGDVPWQELIDAGIAADADE